MNRPIVRLVDLGQMHYRPALELQESLVQKIKSGSQDHFLLSVEHYPVYTVGIRRKEYGPEQVEKLKKLGADFVPTNRGGLITFHGPGQIVLYPILNLNKFAFRGCKFKSAREKLVMGMRWYVNTLEQTVIDSLKEDFGIASERSPHTGVWIKDDKVCAMGVHNSDLVTSHGLALNCNVDLSWFKHIVPCGIIDKGVTSISQEIKKPVSLDYARESLVRQFEKKFECLVQQ